jgi:hypothetical protein
VYDKRLRQVCLDLVNPQNVIGIIERPALGVLTASDFIHHNTHEVATRPAFGKQLCRQQARVQSRSPEALALEPGLHSAFTALEIVEISESRYERLIDGQIAAVNRKSARGEQHVVEQVRSGAMTADDEYWACASFVGQTSLQMLFPGRGRVGIRDVQSRVQTIYALINCRSIFVFCDCKL